MDQDSRKILIGGAVFLEKHGQAQEQAQDHSRRFTQRATLTQSNPEFAETVKILLDSMSLFLTTGGGSPFITACSLDLPRDEHRTHLANQSSLKFPAPDDTAPATDPKCAEAIVGKDQRPPKFTLRIARNGECSNGKNQVLKNLAREIITFLQTSTPDQAKILDEISERCRGKIRDCIIGHDRPVSRIDRFSAILKSLGQRQPPEYIPNLENIRYSANGDIYTQQNAGKAYRMLVETLKRFVGRATKVIDGDRRSVWMVFAAATVIRRDKVYMTLLQKSLPDEEEDVAKRFLERLAAYDLALNGLLDVRRRLDKLKPLLANKITISLLPSRRYRLFQQPSLEELERLATTDSQKLQIHETMKNWYPKYIRENGDLKEHCEIQLVRFYIENPDTVPVMAYLSVPKLSCFLCSKFLKHLSDPRLDGPRIEFCVRGEHGKVYGMWHPPDDIRATKDMKDRVLSSLNSVANDVRGRVCYRLERSPDCSRVGSDMPPWPSEEDLVYMGDPALEVIDWLWEKE